MDYQRWYDFLGSSARMVGSLKLPTSGNGNKPFRVYATIYCNANPTRTGEIWQYIYMINSAASSFQWDKVAHYDYTFQTINV